MRKLRLRLWRDERGLAGVEFALILPVLVLFSLVMIETSRFLLLNLKLSHVATSMGDLATRERELSVGTLDNLFNSVQHLIQPFPFDTMGVVIVSGVTEDAGNAMTVSWQRRGAGDLDPTSEVGTAGGAATLPETIDVGANQTMVVSEAFFQYQPWLLGVIPTRLLRHVAFYRPRLGLLTQLQAN